MMVPKAWIKILLGSHLAAVLLGVAIGYVFDLRIGKTATWLNQAFGHAVASDATTLAFRYGSAEHARTIVSAVQYSDLNDTYRWSNKLVRDLQLSVICRELSDLNCEHEFLMSAMADCQQLHWSTCNAEGLNKLAVKIAADRKPMAAAR